MSKRDYKLISVLREELNRALLLDGKQYRLNTIRHLTMTLAAELKQDNPRFDRKSFIRSCGW